MLVEIRARNHSNPYPKPHAHRLADESAELVEVVKSGERGGIGNWTLSLEDAGS